ncbi:MAG: polysaccharide deacetylase family protein [Candidatus Krumholzibacteria bacterium]|nr:polysaccharide deacetylase family protein [Candidatus Krumholzibacteria bacterium]MDH4337483.1 polysaccharide deacetylase family protein [Candidatus Krumholzibacteria bacterium]MDH5268298.1 polysaccharide deacetylase family protein [Candidatus Krumholzibacteria bacterium]
MLPLLAVAAVPLALHAVWRIRYGYPPQTLPRVLCFHKISRRFCLEGTWTTPQRFAAMIDRLLERGWTFIDEATFLHSLEAPDPANARRAFLTFDDGYAHLADTAFSVLAERGIPFHVFLVTDYTGRDNTWDLGLGRPRFRHLDDGVIREMASAGVSFGSHSAAHADLTRLPDAALRDDLARSRDEVARLAGRPARTLSYPFGIYNDAVRRAAAEAGYAAAFSLYPAHRNRIVDRHALRRDAVYIIDPVWGVETKLRPGPLYGLEEMKCRAINAVARLTPLLKSKRASQPG